MRHGVLITAALVLTIAGKFVLSQDSSDDGDIDNNSDDGDDNDNAG